MAEAVPHDIRTNIDGTPIAGLVANEHAIKLSGANGRMKIMLLSVQIKRIAGASVDAYTPFITDKAGSASTSIHRKWIGAATAAGTMLETLNISRVMRTDADGNIYLNIGQVGAGADTFEYEITYVVVQ